jgi:hypothetical protein
VNAVAAIDHGHPISESNARNFGEYHVQFTNLRLWFVSGGGSRVLQTFSADDTGWVHVAIAWNTAGGPDSFVTWVNGVKTTGHFSMKMSAGTTLHFGRRGALSHFGGQLDDVRMFDGLLTDADVDALFNE